MGSGDLCSSLFLWSWTTLGSTELAPPPAIRLLLSGGSILPRQDGGDRGPAIPLSGGFRRRTGVLHAGSRVRTGGDHPRAALSSSGGLAVWIRRLCVRWASSSLGTVCVARCDPKIIVRKGLLCSWPIWRCFARPRGARKVSSIPGGSVSRNSPLEWLIIRRKHRAVLSRSRTRNKRSLHPFLIFAGLMILATLRVTTGAPRYALPFMPACRFRGAGDRLIWLARRPARVAFAAATALSLGLLLSAWLTVNRHPAGADGLISVVLDVIRSDHSGGGPPARSSGLYSVHPLLLPKYAFARLCRR